MPGAAYFETAAHAYCATLKYLQLRSAGPESAIGWPGEGSSRFHERGGEACKAHIVDGRVSRRLTGTAR